MSFIKTSTDFFNTGMLPNTTFIRLKQGLQPQNISNNCMSGCGCKSQICNKCSLYPSYTPNINYCGGGVPKGCPCTRYIYQY
jgi:hypothetical protein